jgi:type II secretory pathway pseudopilin PulG
MGTKENLNKGITLVALVITIIILLILAGVAITTLTQTGLFENAKQAKNAMENAQTKENAILSDYSSEINEYISSNRNDKENSQSLINKDDGIYNKSEGGYIFNTSQNNITYTSNNIITLSESIENYNYIEFECDNNYSTEGYSYPFSQRYSVSQIKEHYSNTNEFVYKNVFWIIYNSGDYWNRVSFWLKDDKTIMFQYGRSTDTSVFNKIRITNIKGIK